MKIRTGFVSNSSSSSFCIIGLDTNQSTFELAKKIALAENKTFDFDVEDFDYEKCSDLSGSKSDGDVFEYYGNYEDCELNYIGIGIRSFGDDMTINEMKKDIQSKIKKLTNEEIDINKIRLIYDELSY